MAIAPLFEYGDDHPAGDQAALVRWDVDKKDLTDSDAPDFPSRVRARPVAKVMNFGDYDHDGRATEFILQIGTLPCGKRMSVVVGISGRKPRLHAFTTVEHPEKPLVLRVQHWESLLQAKAPIRVIDWLCGDHASETETELELRAEAGRIGNGKESGDRLGGTGWRDTKNMIIPIDMVSTLGEGAGLGDMLLW